ncbi:dihydrodipicolinate reductase [Actinomadura craniellae]|uniref:Dihydrodipicolinate reductase n=1 Tax=Actinomadura craniellae TaxID=2231787 RepID=A0A365H142_9ACTN|nr:dihydrodipicolinate reductase [Actinomadura craniellae]RAY12791.1 dihydrodipicolinate reductase [Actinomadura craniellae]
MTIRVIQWATGAIGRTCLRAVLDSPDLELAGLFVYGDRKAGRDAGDIARRPTTGVIATRDRAEILATPADVVIHTPRLQVPYETHDADICALLRSGKNVVTTAGHHFPRAHGREREEMFLDACRAGGTTLYGVGISPGVVGERIVLALTGVCLDLEHVGIDEVLDASRVPDPNFAFDVMGMGSDPAALDLTAGELPVLYGKLYSETLAFMAERLGLPVDRIEPDHHVETTPRDLTVAAGLIRAGTVAATEWRWHVISGGRRALTLAIVWTMDPELPRYAGRDHWTVTVTGRPGLTMTLNLIEPDDPNSRTTAGQFVTSGPVIRALPEVVAAPPGIFEPPVFAPYTAGAAR